MFVREKIEYSNPSQPSGAPSSYIQRRPSARIAREKWFQLRWVAIGIVLRFWLVVDTISPKCPRVWLSHYTGPSQWNQVSLGSEGGTVRRGMHHQDDRPADSWTATRYRWEGRYRLETPGKSVDMPLLDALVLVGRCYARHVRVLLRKGAVLWTIPVYKMPWLLFQ